LARDRFAIALSLSSWRTCHIPGQLLSGSIAARMRPRFEPCLTLRPSQMSSRRANTRPDLGERQETPLVASPMRFFGAPTPDGFAFVPIVPLSRAGSLGCRTGGEAEEVTSPSSSPSVPRKGDAQSDKAKGRRRDVQLLHCPMLKKVRPQHESTVKVSEFCTAPRFALCLRRPNLRTPTTKRPQRKPGPVWV
jgi:hypothetical protein